MKCTGMRLLNRKGDASPKYFVCESVQPTVYTAEEYHCYSFNYLRKKSNQAILKTDPEIHVTNVTLPEDLHPWKNGTSMEKWSRKKPRLRSAKSLRPRIYDFMEDLDFRIRINQYLQDSESSRSGNEVLYEIHPDIEELLLRSEKYSDHQEDGNKSSSNIRKRGKKKKTIKISLSRPISPETEQIIRVDVTSNVSIEGSGHVATSRSNFSNNSYRSERCNKAKNLTNRTSDVNPESSEEDNELVMQYQRLAVNS